MNTAANTAAERKNGRATPAAPADAAPRCALRLLLAAALVWALEIFVFQALSFRFDYPVPLVKRVGAQTVRLLLDVCLAIGLVFLLPRAALPPLFLLFIVFAQGAGYYRAMFGRVLTWRTLQGQFAEGLEAVRLEWSYVNWTLLALLAGAFFLKLRLLGRARSPGGGPRRRERLAIGGLALLGYGLLLGVAMRKIDRPEKLRSFASADRLGMTYGYLPLWVCEACCLDADHLLREAVAQRALATDRLSALEMPLAPAGDVVLIQVESLDWRVLNHRAEGRLVMPFLNRLAEEAMLFKITAVYRNGSGDADFVMLNAVPPSPAVMTYKLRQYPYHQSLPRLAARAGYRSVALHGNSGRFFERREAFRRMGFDRLLFLEELREEMNAPVSLWGVRDDVVLSLSRRLLDEKPPSERHLHYIITLTSHQPFIYLEPEEHLFLPGRRDIRSRYFNSMNFVDRQLAAYSEGLAAGTLLIIFGDHRAMVEYEADAGTGAMRPPQHVPLLIHCQGDRLAGRQRSRGSPAALSGELTMLDAASYIRRMFLQEGTDVPRGAEAGRARLQDGAPAPRDGPLPDAPPGEAAAARRHIRCPAAGSAICFSCFPLHELSNE